MSKPKLLIGLGAMHQLTTAEDLANVRKALYEEFQGKYEIVLVPGMTAAVVVPGLDWGEEER